MNGFEWNFQEISTTGPETSDSILRLIQHDECIQAHQMFYYRLLFSRLIELTDGWPQINYANLEKHSDSTKPTMLDIFWKSAKS